MKQEFQPPSSTHPGEILEAYAHLERLHRQMLDAARTEDWEAAARISGLTEAATSKIDSLDGSDSLDATGQATVREHIERTQALIRDLRALAEPALSTSAALLADNAQRSKIASAYGA